MSARGELTDVFLQRGHGPTSALVAAHDLLAGHRVEVLVDLIEKAAEWDGQITVQELRRMAAGKASPVGPTATRERGFAHSWPGEPPHLTVNLTFGEEWTDEGVEEVTKRVRLAARVGLTDVPVDFFQPGSGYTHRDGSDFRCVAVSPDPVTGQRLAIGWRIEHGTHSIHVVGINQWNHEYDGCEPPAPVEPAEIEFAATGTLTLTDWRYTELAPDGLGITRMQIGGWLPEGWSWERTPGTTGRMVRAVLPSQEVPQGLDVRVEVKSYGEPRRYMKIQWRKDGDA